MTTNITYKFLGDATSLKKATKTASSELDKMGSKLKSSFSATSLLGAASAAFSIGQIVDVLRESSKAYVEDSKAQEVMARTMVSTTGATRSQVRESEDFIAKLQTQTSIIDDKLRPAFNTMLTATEDVGKAQEMLTLATDISAGTGKDLTMVTQALGKAYNGQFASLNKLIPGISKAKDPMDKLQKTFGGMAEAAADTDPYGKIQIVLNDLQEQLGEQVMPLLNDFTDWLSGPEGAEVIKELGYVIDGVGVAFEGLSDFLDSDGGKITKQIADMVALTTPLGTMFSFFGTLGKQEEMDNYLTTKLVEYQDSLEDRKLSLKKTVEVIPEIEEDFKKKVAPIPQRIKDAAARIKEAGDQFKKSINFGEYLDEKSGVFDTTKFMDKFRGIVAAAKELPTKLKQLRKAGASPEVLQQVIAMGPEQGLAVANGFLSNAGSAKEYSAGLNTLSMLGQKSAAQAGTSNTYEINVNKANMTAEEIITAIQKYERKTGKKVVF